MARQEGTFPVSANFEVKIKGEFDARKYVTTYEELLSFTDGSYIPYGFTVTCAGADDLLKRGVWMCINENDLTNPISWYKLTNDVPLNGLISTAGIEQLGLTVTVLGPTYWDSAGVLKTVTGDTSFNIVPATSGYTKIGLIYGRNDSTLDIVYGNESLSAAVEPNLPTNTVRIAPVYIKGDEIQPPLPDLSGYAKLNGNNVFIGINTFNNKVYFTNISNGSYDTLLGLNSNGEIISVSGITFETSDVPVSGGTLPFSTGGAFTELSKKADLVNGVVPASQLPSYVDDVVEYDTLADFPVNGESGKIYLATDTNKAYRWSGSVYVEISASPGTTDNVPEGVNNLYYTNQRVKDYSDTLYVPLNRNINTSSPLLGGGNLNSNLTLSIQEANSTQSGYLTSLDWNSFNSKQASLSGTGIVRSVSGTISYINGNSSTFVKGDGSLDSNVYITGVTSTDIVNALGYTPYDNANPAGYITSVYLNGYATESWVNDNFYTKLQSINLFKDINWVPSWTDILNRPTNLSQFTNDLGNYGNWLTENDANMLYSLLGHTHTFASLTDKPTTLAGYGITDAAYDANVIHKTGDETKTGNLSVTSLFTTSDLGVSGNANVFGNFTSNGFNNVLGTFSFLQSGDGSGSRITFIEPYGTSSGTIGNLLFIPNSSGNLDPYWNNTNSFTGAKKFIFANDLNIVAFTGDYGDLINVPTKLSDFFNDLGDYGGFLTEDEADLLYSKLGHTHTFASLTDKPTTLAGYGITNAYTKSEVDSAINAINIGNYYTKSESDNRFAPIVHTHTWSQITDKPTTVSGYGISDVYTKTDSDNRFSPLLDGLKEVGSIILSGNNVTVSQPVRWRINGVNYEKLTNTTINVPSATSGYTRIDLIYADTSGNILRVAGTETTGTAIEPNLPANTVRVAPVYIDGATIQQPAPDLSGYAKLNGGNQFTGNQFINGPGYTTYLQAGIFGVVNTTTGYAANFNPNRLFFGDTAGGATAFRFGGIDYQVGSGIYTQTLPLKSGTFAMLSDITSSISGYTQNPTNFTAGRIPYTTGANTLADSSNLLWDNSNNLLTINGNLNSNLNSATRFLVDVVTDTTARELAGFGKFTGGNSGFRINSVNGASFNITSYNNNAIGWFLSNTTNSYSVLQGGLMTFGANSGTGDKVSVINPSNQFAIGTSASVFTRFNSDSSGYLNIIPSGGLINITGNTTGTGTLQFNNVRATSELRGSTMNVENTMRVLNKAGTDWVTWGIRSTNGTDATMDLSRITGISPEPTGNNPTLPIYGFINGTYATVITGSTGYYNQRIHNFTHNGTGGSYRGENKFNIIAGTNTTFFEYDPNRWDLSNLHTSGPVTGVGMNFTMRSLPASVNTNSIGLNAMTVNFVDNANARLTSYNGIVVNQHNPSGITSLVHAFTAGGVGTSNGGTVQNYRGFYVLDGTADNYRGFEGVITSGANKYNLYMVGSAKNYLNGTTLIGTNVDDGVNKLQVGGTIKSTGFKTSATGTINAEGLRINHDSAFISGYNTADTVRNGYLQFGAGSVSLQAEQGNRVVRLNPNGGRVLVNTSTDDGVNTLQVNGTVTATSFIGNVTSATSWGGREANLNAFVTAPDVMLMLDTDGKVKLAGDATIKQLLNLGNGSNLNNNASSATYWGSREADFTSFGTSIAWLTGGDNVTNKITAYDASSVKAFLNLNDGTYLNNITTALKSYDSPNTLFWAWVGDTGMLKAKVDETEFTIIPIDISGSAKFLDDGQGNRIGLETGAGSNPVLVDLSSGQGVDTYGNAYGATSWSNQLFSGIYNGPLHYVMTSDGNGWNSTTLSDFKESLGSTLVTEKVTNFNTPTGFKILEALGSTVDNQPVVDNWGQGIQFSTNNNPAYANQLVFSAAGGLYVRSKSGGPWSDWARFITAEETNLQSVTSRGNITNNQVIFTGTGIRFNITNQADADLQFELSEVNATTRFASIGSSVGNAQLRLNGNGGVILAGTTDYVGTEKLQVAGNFSVGKVADEDRYINVNGAGVSRKAGYQINHQYRLYDTTDGGATYLSPNAETLVINGSVVIPTDGHTLSVGSGAYKLEMGGHVSNSYFRLNRNGGAWTMGSSVGIAPADSNPEFHWNWFDGTNWFNRMRLDTAGNLNINSIGNIPVTISSSTFEAYISLRANSSDSVYGTLLRTTGNDFGIYHGNGVVNSLYINGNTREITTSNHLFVNGNLYVNGNQMMQATKWNITNVTNESFIRGNGEYIDIQPSSDVRFLSIFDGSPTVSILARDGQVKARFFRSTGIGSETFRMASDNGFISGYSTDETIRNGYIQISNGYIDLQSEQGNKVIRLNGTGGRTLINKAEDDGINAFQVNGGATFNNTIQLNNGSDDGADLTFVGLSRNWNMDNYQSKLRFHSGGVVYADLTTTAFSMYGNIYTSAIEANGSLSSGSWIAGNFGDGSTSDRVVMGSLNGVATIGGHNRALNSWANLIINRDGGNVGIGTIPNTYKLEIAGNVYSSNNFIASGELQLAYQGTPKFGMLVYNSDTFTMNTTLISNAFSVTQDGRFGINNTNPAAKFEVNASSGTLARIMGAKGYMLLDNGGSGYNYLKAEVASEFRIGASDATVAILDSGGFTSYGNLRAFGVISNAPSEIGVHIGKDSGNYASIQLVGDASTGSYIDFSSPNTDYNGRILYDNTSNYFTFGTAGSSNKMILDSTGSLQVEGVLRSRQGYQNTNYVAGRNRIWSFADADTYGLSYHQGTSSIYGRDGIGIHFGDANNPQYNFLQNGVAKFTGYAGTGSRFLMVDSDGTLISGAGSSDLPSISGTNQWQGNQYYNGSGYNMYIVPGSFGVTDTMTYASTSLNPYRLAISDDSGNNIEYGLNFITTHVNGSGFYQLNLPTDRNGTVALKEKKIVTSTSTVNVTLVNDIELIDASSSSITVNLPVLSSNLNKQVIIKKIDSSSNSVTITASSGETIEDSSSINLNNKWDYITLTSTTSAWIITSLRIS